jgi:hypothetical protein
VDDGEPKSSQRQSSHLREALPQLVTVVVAVDPHEPGRPLFEVVQQSWFHPVAGVDDHVRRLDRRP